MRAVLRLEILLRVPVAVEQDDGISCREVDALAAGAGAEEEDLVVRAGVEGFDVLPPDVLFDRAVDAADLPAVQDCGPVFEDIELGFEL